MHFATRFFGWQVGRYSRPSLNKIKDRLAPRDPALVGLATTIGSFRLDLALVMAVVNAIGSLAWPRSPSLGLNPERPQSISRSLLFLL